MYHFFNCLVTKYSCLRRSYISSTDNLVSHSLPVTSCCMQNGLFNNRPPNSCSWLLFCCRCHFWLNLMETESPCVAGFILWKFYSGTTTALQTHLYLPVRALGSVHLNNYTHLQSVLTLTCLVNNLKKASNKKKPQKTQTTTRKGTVLHNAFLEMWSSITGTAETVWFTTDVQLISAKSSVENTRECVSTVIAVSIHTQLSL